MAAAATVNGNLDEAPLAAGAIVATPAGTVGRVVGFYRTETPTVLVEIEPGRCSQFVETDLSRVPPRAA